MSNTDKESQKIHLRGGEEQGWEALCTYSNREVSAILIDHFLKSCNTNFADGAFTIHFSKNSTSNQLEAHVISRQ